MAFSNRDRLRRKIRAIPVQVRKAARDQLKANAQELVETMKGFAPVQEGPLVSSIKEQDVSDSTRISRRVSAGDRSAPYVSWVEFGHGQAAPRPFFWPAYRLKRRRFKARMTRTAKKAVQEAIK
ncbi:HK97-gp10 family putative phage morphogenesis protein [Brevundimonas sp.]|uniref:HK97-gp10 family putative phage morphogenesis protein n=1 Tax=Brevundimonas sp. TaxID=1871086 RepID=UPI002EDAFC20